MTDAPGRVLVLGANGETGQQVLLALARKGIAARAMVRSAEKAQKITSTRDIFVGDITEENLLRALSRTQVIRPCCAISMRSAVCGQEGNCLISKNGWGLLILYPSDAPNVSMTSSGERNNEFRRLQGKPDFQDQPGEAKAAPEGEKTKMSRSGSVTEGVPGEDHLL